MLRINLLPPYIYDKQKKIPWIIGSLALIPITLGALLWWGAIAQAAVTAANDRKQAAQAQKDQYDKLDSDIKKEHAAVDATKQKQTFVSNAIVYNQSWPQVYTTMRNVTSPRVLLKSMYVSDDRKSVNFTGWCQYEEDLVRWWMYLRSQTALFSNVHFRLPDHPWPPKEEAGAGGGDVSGGPRGAMGMPGGSAGGMGSGMMSMMGPGMMGGSSGGGRGGQGPGSFGGGGGNSDAVGPEEIEGKKGIKFSAFVTLKEPFAKGIAPPSWAVGGAPAGGGPGGVMPGMGGTGGMMMSSGMSSSK
jgi:hypothetical protein